MTLPKQFLVGCVLLALLSASGQAEVTETDRVIAAGKLWAMAKYFHPALAYRDIDWDGAWVKAYPDLKAASNAQEYERAVKVMLDALNDPLTTTTKQRTSSGASNGAITTKWEPDSVLTITVPNSEDWTGMSEQLDKLSGEIPKARAVVFDLRAVQSDTSAFLYGLEGSTLEGSLTSKSITTPAYRARLHSGLVSTSRSSGGYYSAFQVIDGRLIQPQAGVKDVPVVFVVSGQSPVPPVAVALQLAGNGHIVSEGPITDASLVGTMPVPLAFGIQVDLRRGELIYPDGSTGFDADRTVAPGEGLKTALLMAVNPIAARRLQRSSVPASALPRIDRDYPERTYPGPAYRTLAALRIWGVYHFFYPYKALMGEDWDAVLNKFWPKFEAARDTREYNFTVAEMVSHVHDSHAIVKSKMLHEFYGSAATAVVLRWIENSPVVSRVLDEEAKSAGIDVGDVLLSTASPELKVRNEELLNSISASTPQALMREVCFYLLNGSDNSSVAVKVRKPNGEVHEAMLTRKAEYYKHISPERTGEIVRILPSNIGYVDLDRLPQSMVDEMFEKLKGTRAIIFDMRGYPLGTVWAIAPRLTEEKSPVAALFRRAVLTSPEDGDLGLGESLTQALPQRLPGTSKWKYRNQTVMLIDERTQSQAEHTGLFFEVANKTKFVGSPTAGANGDLTQFTVPGGIAVSMSGQEVRHADGRQLQRIGLQPDIPIAPTIAGIASKRDEVLERAVQYITTGK